MANRLNAEEREILEQAERGELVRVPNFKQELEYAQQAARNTINKTRRVRLSLSERDFQLANAKANEEGIPYQIFLTSIIHKYLAGRMTESR